MEGDLEAFDFVLAQDLHMTVEEMQRRMSNREYLAWKAFYVYREAQGRLALDTAAAARRR